MIAKADYYGSPHIGIFCTVNDNFALVPLSVKKEFTQLIKNTLDVDIIKTNMANTPLLGVFSASNNKHIVVPDILEKEELSILKDVFPEVIVIEEKYTALGNLVAMNDHGTACSMYVDTKVLPNAKHTKVGGSDLVGSVTFATNKGFLCHTDASQKELKELESIFKVKGDVGSVNLGDPFVKCGIMGNKNGIVVGNLTSGPEMTRIDEIFILE